jgi:hypothetical protein
MQDAWEWFFPRKTPEQREREARVAKAVRRGDLHWSALEDVKQGRPISCEQIAQL